MTGFPEKLKAARKKRGWTQKKVAETLGITDVAYGDYERGRIYPSPGNLRLMCEIFEELDFNEMAGLIEQEKKQEELKRTQQRMGRLQPTWWINVLQSTTLLQRWKSVAGRADALGGNATAFVLNTGQELPIHILSDPVLSSDGVITLQINSGLPRDGARLDLIDLLSVKILKTFDLPLEPFLGVDVSENPDYTPLLEEMKQQNVQTISLKKVAFAYRIWWEE